MEKWERDYQKMVANIETVKEAVGPKSMIQALLMNAIRLYAR